MINRQKLKKLKNNPIHFFKDSKLNVFNKLHGQHIQNQVKEITKDQIAETMKNQVTETTKKQIPTNTNDDIFKVNGNSKIKMKPFVEDFNFDFLLNQLQKTEVTGVYIKPIFDDLKPAICILESHREKFITIFLSLIFKENFTFKYKNNNNEVKIPESISSFWSDIATMKTIDIRLSTNRVLGKKLSYFWFRLEFCAEQNDFIMFPTNNIVSRKLWKHTIKEHQLFDSGIKDYSLILAKSHEIEISFDIDLVFTWVNSADEDWQKMYHQFKPDTVFDKEKSQTDSASTSRFLSRDELKYSLRSWEKYGSFIRNIYIVSNCKAPEWLNTEHPKIKWIDHKDIIPASALPTFSSHAIEACLHNISGLSNYFIYCNDDILLTRPLTPYTFFYHNGIAKLRMDPYGNINGQVTEGEPDYLNAARNGNKLLENMFGKTPTQLHTHSPQSMRVDILSEMNQKFKSDFDKTIHNKFRNIEDISVTSYLYQHYALLSGHALQSSEKTEMIIERHNYKQKFKDILKLNLENNFNTLPISVCINDGADSHLNENWNKEVINFLNNLFPQASNFEK